MKNVQSSSQTTKTMPYFVIFVAMRSVIAYVKQYAVIMPSNEKMLLELIFYIPFLSFKFIRHFFMGSKV